MKRLVLMRGLPGSGKSTLAKSIAQEAQDKGLTYSIHATDDFFMVDGEYKFDPNKLGKYHHLNKKATEKSVSDGIDVVIVDNTNLSLKEVQPYVKLGLDKGYRVDFAEPTTAWAKNVDELLKKNVHKVPLEAYQRMMSKYMPVDEIGRELSQRFGCIYSTHTKSLYKGLPYEV